MNSELAELGADSTLSPERKKQMEFGIRERYAGEEANSADRDRADRLAGSGQKASETAEAAAHAKAALEAQERLVGAGRGAPGGIREQNEGLQKEIGGL